MKIGELFKLEDTIANAIKRYIEEMHSISFYHELKKSYIAKTVPERYKHYCIAFKMLPTYFEHNQRGLDDLFSSWILVKRIHEIYLNNNKQYKEITVIDIGCGWGNVGRILYNKYRHIAYRSDKNVKLQGYDASEDMLKVASDNKWDRGYESMMEYDVKENSLIIFEDETVDFICSANCLMQDAEIGHPDHTFLEECYRVLKKGGRLCVTRRELTWENNNKIYLDEAKKVGFKNEINGRILDTLVLEWVK